MSHTTGPWHMEAISTVGHYTVTDADGLTVCNTLPMSRDNARLIAAAPDLLSVLVQAVETSGFSLSGAADTRAAEHGEPAWVCNARAAIARATGEA